MGARGEVGAGVGGQRGPGSGGLGWPGSGGLLWAFGRWGRRAGVAGSAVSPRAAVPGSPASPDGRVRDAGLGAMERPAGGLASVHASDLSFLLPRPSPGFSLSLPPLPFLSSFSHRWLHYLPFLISFFPLLSFPFLLSLLKERVMLCNLWFCPRGKSAETCSVATSTWSFSDSSSSINIFVS